MSKHDAKGDIAADAPPDRFTTARLVLQKPDLSDSRAIFDAYTSDPEVVRFLSWQAHSDEGETRDFLTLCLERWASGANFAYVIVRASHPDQPVGMIELREKDHSVSFGYVLARSQWGNGYMAEALAALIDWSLARPDIWRTFAFCDFENRASARVMEKAGMTFEGVLRRYFVHPNVSPEPRDCRLYAKVKA